MGILTAAAVNVPPHSPLTARQVHFQLEETETHWLFVSNQDQLQKIRQIRSELPHLRGIVAFDSEKAGGEAWPWTGFLQRGRKALVRHATELGRREEGLRPDDLATIMGTSGTTGNPKGVMLTHGYLLSNAFAMHEDFSITADSLMFCWLP